MDAVTYPNTGIINFINENMIPLRLSFDAKPWSAEFIIQWTPTIITLDQEGKEHHRTVGFLSPEELIPSLILGIGKVYFDGSNFDKAAQNFEMLADYPNSNSTPEGIYWRGVSKFKNTHDPTALKETYQYLEAKYPSSEWAKRAYPYRLLEPLHKVVL